LNEKVSKFIEWVVTMILAVAITGVLIYALWPEVIPVLFPGLVERGLIARSINFWTSIGVSFMAGLIFKPPQKA